MAGVKRHPRSCPKTVEADETYFGNAETLRERPSHLPPPAKGGKSGPANERAVVSLVERGGKAPPFHVASANAATVKTFLRTNASRKSKLMTDESRLYTEVSTEYARHGTANHSAGEYVGFDDPSKYTNTVEGYFPILKRRMKGVCQHCGEPHPRRYNAGFDFRTPCT